ncbi:MAG: CBS domain-containing protein [Cyanobacteria bacterium]|nr:CBS domain-containing protein [Cyanobacteriota bacterium]MDW8200846.1 CBS domain-containing protein [Cyanobacteriota bacterium SKYGB_h_bin112]
MINQQFLTVTPDTPLIDTVTQMANADEGVLASCVLVVNHDALVGILTAWDVVRLISHHTSLEDVVAKDAMTHPVITLAEADLDHLCKTPSVFYQQQVRHLPVVNQQEAPIGVITPASIQRALPLSNLEKLRHVGDVMTTQFVAVGIDTAIIDLTQLMTDQRLNGVVVVSSKPNGDRSPIGIVTSQDIVRFRACGLPLKSTVEAVMHPLTVQLRTANSLWLAHQEMRQQQLPCLPIVNGDGVLLGVISDMDILRASDPTERYQSGRQVQQSMQQLKVDRLHVLQHRALELERLVQERTAQLEEQAKCDRLLAATTMQIHQSLDLHTILSTTVSEVRRLLNADRTIICRFDVSNPADQYNPVTEGIIAMESVLPAWESMTGHAIPCSCFDPYWFSAYRNGHSRVINDIYRAGLPQSYVDLMTQFQVRSSLIVPIVMGKRLATLPIASNTATDDTQQPLPAVSAHPSAPADLWGLLIVHQCASHRQWKTWEVNLLEQLTKQVSIAIHQSELHQQVQTELQERRRVEAELANILRNLEQTVQERTASWQEVADRLILEIAERKRAETELQHTTDHLRAVLDAVPGLVFWVTADLRYLGVNRHMADTFNLPPVEFVGQPVGFLHLGSQLTDLLADFFASPRSTINQEIEISFNGNCHAYLIVAQKYNNNQAAIVVGIDITDHKRAGMALQASEAKFRDLVEQTNDWVWEIDLGLNFTYVNPRVYDITGYDQTEILGRSMIDFMPDDETVRMHTLLSYHIHHHQPFSQIEATFIHKAGQTIVLEISGTPVLNTDGKPQGYRGITRDITERKQVERDIRKALTKEKELNELKTRFITIASHEFRTPLTSILASAESIERYYTKWPMSKQITVLRRIQSAAKHMAVLLNDVLLVGKAEAGKLSCNLGILNVEDFCADLIDEVCPENQQTQRIKFTSCGDCTNLLLDEKLLRHILTNLLSNALKYSPPDTVVQLTLSCNDSQVVFQVHDQGIGIPANDQKRLFESFHRGANVGNIPGTGLGLTIVKNAVKAHGGEITVSSQAGIGTTFTVLIPQTQGATTSEKDSGN